MRSIPRLYAILDYAALKLAGLDPVHAAEDLLAAGVQMLQYRDKLATPIELLDRARRIGAVFAGSDTVLLLNDSPHVALAAGWDGVHVGQTDLPVAAARDIVGRHCLVGVSTHTAEQFQAAARTEADYIAFGPIFPTRSKADVDAPVGLDGLRAVRAVDRRPLVAIGGISLDDMASVYAAGANSIAMIGAFLSGEGGVRERAKRLLDASEEGSGEAKATP